MFIPYASVFSGTNTDGIPCTQNGFTGARNGNIVPEGKFNGFYEPKNGAQLFTNKNGIKTLVGTYDAKMQMFVPE